MDATALMTAARLLLLSARSLSSSWACAFPGSAAFSAGGGAGSELPEATVVVSAPLSSSCRPSSASR
jgi:hypothetical protein